jgi:hypothetical protein
VQHIAHDLMEKSGKTVSEAIRLAVGIVKNPPDKWGPEAKAAAKKAAAEWEAKKGVSKPTARGVAESLSLGDRVALRSAALSRLGVLREAFGDDLLALAEAKSASWSPELKRTASAAPEGERFEVHHEGQQVGTVASRKGYMQGGSRPIRWSARAVNGQMVGDTEDSKQAAMDALRKHLEEAPARVGKHTNGKFLVARPETYSGAVSYNEFPSEGSARFAAGLPEQPTAPEREAKVVALGEMARFDALTLGLLGEELPPACRPLAESAADRVPLGLREASDPDGDGDDDSSAAGDKDSDFSVGDRVNYQHSNFGRVPARVTKVTARHVHLTSSDPRVSDTRMTHKQASDKLSKTTAARR